LRTPSIPTWLVTVKSRLHQGLTTCCIAAWATLFATPLGAQTPTGSDAAAQERSQKQSDSVYRWITMHAEPKRKSDANAKPRPKPEAPAPTVRKPEIRSTATESPAITETVSTPNAQPAPISASAVVAPIAAASAPASAPAAIPVPEEHVVAAAEEDEEEEPLRAIAQPQPEIPRELRTSVVTGRVIVGFTVQPDGTVAEAAIVRATNRRLSKPALDAISKWRFQPIRTARAVQVEIEFNLQ